MDKNKAKRQQQNKQWTVQQTKQKKTGGLC